MSKLKDLTGKRFGKLVVIKRADDYVYPNGKRRVQWLCKCDCGNNIIIVVNNLGRNSQSCGCARKDTIRKKLEKHNKYDLSGEYGKGWATNTGHEFIFDLEDYDLIKQYSWGESGNGYLRNQKWNQNVLFLHRLIMDCPENMYVDHKNGNTYDNRKSNLRIVTIQQNNMNQKIRDSTKSGVKGVGFDKRINKWRARIYINGKEIFLGYYENKEDAIMARVVAEEKYFGEYSYNNSRSK